MTESVAAPIPASGYLGTVKSGRGRKAYPPTYFERLFKLYHFSENMRPAYFGA